MSPIHSERAKAIQAAISLPTARSEFRVAPIVIGGEKSMVEVYRLPTSLLAYNIRNGRFAAELRAKERELGRKLDTVETADAEIIRDLLLYMDEDATAILKADLRQVGQTEPGIITHDGFVINGNRRMAILHGLHKQEPTGRFEHLDVQILPVDVEPRDLWRIEAGLQLSRDKRLVYGPVNDMFKIREGLDSGLSPEEIAATLYGSGGAQEISEKDERLKLIDSYLNYINKPDDYLPVQRMVEHFINLQIFMRWLDEKVSASKQVQHTWLLITFEMLRTDEFKHMDIRKLRNIYATEESRNHIESSIKSAPDVPVDDASKAAIKDAFDTAVDFYELEENANKPELLLSRAERALTTLLKHRHQVARKKGLHKRVKQLYARSKELMKACSIRQARK